jgi:Tfp pilus assembly protein PilF
VVITTRDLPEKEWRFIAHLGVTAAILPAGQNPPAAPRDSAKSAALLQEALKFLDQKKTPEASAKLQAALDADDRNIAAWKESVALTASTADNAAVIALCRKWALAMPRSYEAHNNLGQYLEKAGNFTQALAEYQKSLTIEWNQPPIVEAVKRVQKKLNP